MIETEQEKTWRLLTRPDREKMEHLMITEGGRLPKGLWDDEIVQNHFNKGCEVLRKYGWLPTEWVTVKSEETIRHIFAESVYNEAKKFK